MIFIYILFTIYNIIANGPANVFFIIIYRLWYIMFYMFYYDQLINHNL